MLVVLFITVFLFNGDVKFVAIPAPSPEACMQGGPEAKNKVEQDSSVRVAKWACFGVDPAGNKT